MIGTGRALARYLPAAALFVALLVAWQLAVTVLRVREYLLPAPLTVARAMVGDEIPWLRHLGITSLEIVGAFALAGAAGVALGVVVAWSPLLARALLPFLVFVNTLPKVAVAPLFLLWMGYGVLPNMLIGALIGFFPVVINTAVGLTQVDEELLDLGRVFNAPKWKVFAKIRIPNAYPYILSALKITATAAVVGAIVGRVRRLAARARLRDRHHPGEHEHAGGLRRAGLDLAGRSRGVWPGGAGRAADRAVGGNRGVKEDIPCDVTRFSSRSPSCLPPSGSWWRSARTARAAQQPAQKVVFALNWFPVGDHAAYWVALEKGYYQAARARRGHAELQGLGRFHRQGGHRARRRRPGRQRGGDRLGGPRAPR